jgi:addiction module HigA family antidote
MANEIAAGRPMRQPNHPGKVLRNFVIPALEERGISISAFADHLGVSRNTIHAVLREARGVTPDIAARLERSLGASAAMWLGMQAAHDAWLANQQPGIKAIKRLRVALPHLMRA